MPITSLLEKPKQIDPANIEKELTALWKMAGEKAQQEKTSVMKACAYNLIIYTEDETTAKKQYPILEELTSQYPSRAFVVIDEIQKKEEAIESWINSKCQIISLGQQICDEEITIHTSGMASRRISHTLLGVFVPDIPILLISHAKKPWENQTVPRLFRFTQRTIVDSAEFEDPFTDLPKFAGLVRENSRKLAFGDLNWSRLSVWRGLMSQFFDAESNRPSLNEINRVFIQYDPTPKSLGLTQALYLIGWLASQLKWRINSKLRETKEENFLVEFQTGLRRIECEMIPQEGESTVFGVKSFCLSVINKKKETQKFCVNKTEDEGCLKTILHIGDHEITRITHMHERTDARLLGSELEILGHEVILERSLDIAARLASSFVKAGDATGGSYQAETNIQFVKNTDELYQVGTKKFIDIGTQSIKQNGRFVVALSGGNTPRGIFSLLAQEPYRAQIAWNQVYIFWGDERTVPPEHPDSNYKMAREALLSKVPIPPDHIRRIYGEDSDYEAAAMVYEKKIRELFKVSEAEIPKFNLILLGMGDDGHTASLFPQTHALSETKKLVTGNYVAKLNTFRITFTYPLINNAENILFLVSGESKQNVLKNVLEGGYQPELYPSQGIQPLFGSLLWLVDEAAGKLLTKK